MGKRGSLEMGDVWLERCCDVWDKTVARRWVDWVSRGVLAGGLVAMGITLGTGLASGMEGGLGRALGGLGFVGGFSCIVATRSLLVTEVNVLGAASAIKGRLLMRGGRVGHLLRVLSVWVVVCVANWVGGASVAALMAGADLVTPEAKGGLCAKVSAMDRMSVGSAFVSGIVGNVVVGVASVMTKVGGGGVGEVLGMGLVPAYAFAVIGAGHSTVDGTAVAMAALLGGCQGVGLVGVWVRFVLFATLGNVVGGAGVVGIMKLYDDGAAGRGQARGGGQGRKEGEGEDEDMESSLVRSADEVESLASLASLASFTSSTSSTSSA